MIEDVRRQTGFWTATPEIAVVATGHCHPKVVAAIREQAGKLIHMSGTDFYYRKNMVQLAKSSPRWLPAAFASGFYFGNSGTEAMEAALKMARYHTGRGQFVAFFGAFHGRTMGSLALTVPRLSRKRASSRSCKARIMFPTPIATAVPTARLRIPARWNA